VSDALRKPNNPASARPYWVLRALETTLLVTSLGGVVLFAVSIFSIFRIEADSGASATTALTREIPWASWYGIFIFFGSMLLLQLVRVWLHRYRGEDGAPREQASADARPDAGPLYSEDSREQTPGQDSGQA
jgi:hypothetical protein